MTFNTSYNVGDKIIVAGEEKKIVSIHVYISQEMKVTERYYLGNNEWYTLVYRKEI